MTLPFFKNGSRISLFTTLMGKPKKSAQVASSSTEQGPVTLSSSGDIRLSILVKPGSKFSAITSVDSEGVAVQIGARPVDGEANAELVHFISKVLGLKKNEVTLDRGSKSRNKVVIISSSQATVCGILEKLNAAIGN